MEISDEELGFDANLDFIPLVSDPADDAEQVDRKPVIGAEEEDSSEAYRPPTSHDYESDDSWFEDEKNVNTLNIKYIPHFLLN